VAALRASFAVLRHRGELQLMRYLDLTLPTAAENLALDEALLDEAEAAAQPTETLRLWESPRPLVVVGRSSQIDVEVRADECRRLGIPVLRRSSGGAAVVAGPGCLMYAVVLSYRQRPDLHVLSQAHRYVLDTLAAALAPLVSGVQYRGTSDLAIGQQKFSGNSARCRRDHFLYHGTLLYDFPLKLIGRCLAQPPRMPDYREGRPHETFVTNLPVNVEAIRHALISAWDAREPCENWPAERTAQLAAEKYKRPQWNERGMRAV
jgi:lipoate---protein ligase